MTLGVLVWKYIVKIESSRQVTEFTHIEKRRNRTRSVKCWYGDFIRFWHFTLLPCSIFLSPFDTVPFSYSKFAQFFILLKNWNYLSNFEIKFWEITENWCWLINFRFVNALSFKNFSRNYEFDMRCLIWFFLKEKLIKFALSVKLNLNFFVGIAILWFRDAHGPGWPAGRAGTGLADLSRPSGRADRKWAETLPRKKQGLLEKPRFLIKLTKFTFSIENFLKVF